MCCEEATVDDTSHGEGATDNGTDRGEEVVDWGTGLMVADSDWVQIVPEPQCWYDPTAVAERDVRLVSVGVLIGHQFSAMKVLVRGGHNLHVILVRLQVVTVQLGPVLQWVETTPEVFLTDLLDLAAEGDLVNLVGKVIVVWLDVHGVGRQVKISRNSVDLKPRLEKTARISQFSFYRVFYKTDLMTAHVVLNVYSNKFALHVGKTDVDPDWDSVGGISAADDQL